MFPVFSHIFSSFSKEKGEKKGKESEIEKEGNGISLAKALFRHDDLDTNNA